MAWQHSHLLLPAATLALGQRGGQACSFHRQTAVVVAAIAIPYPWNRPIPYSIPQEAPAVPAPLCWQLQDCWALRHLQRETVVVDRQPTSPPWCRHARLVPRQDLLADEGIVCESALGTKIAEVIDQEAAALCIEALEDVHAAQPLVAPDFGITWTLSIPFNEHILWVLSR